MYPEWYNNDLWVLISNFYVQKKVQMNDLVRLQFYEPTGYHPIDKLVYLFRHIFSVSLTISIV